MCGCRGNRGSTARASSSGTKLTGLAPNNPAVLGGGPKALSDSGDFPVVRVRVVKPVQHLRANQAAWVKGPAVESLIAAGSLAPMLGSSEKTKARMWRVGSANYTDPDVARRVSATTGQPITEIA